MTLAEFVLARIADDRAAVNASTLRLAPDGWQYEEQFGDFGDDERWMIEIPAPRLLAECKAKERIVGLLRQCKREGYDNAAAYLTDAVQALALPYADHEDYRQEWRP